MGFEVVDCGRNRLLGRTIVEGGFRLLSALPSVAVHVVGPEMVVIDANRLPLAVLEREEDDRVALDRPTRMTEAHDEPVDNPDLNGPLMWHVGSLTREADSDAIVSASGERSRAEGPRRREAMKGSLAGSI